MFMLNAGVADYVSPRIIELSRQTFLRDGAMDFDNAYAVAVFDAKTRVGLAEMIIANPGNSVRFGNMGYVPYKDGNGTIYTIYTKQYG